MSETTLLVIIPDRLSVLVAKGEYIPRYYNPGDLFDEVHILTTVSDRLDSEDLAIVQTMVGGARLQIHHLPVPSFRQSLGWQRFMLRGWVAAGVRLARQIEPDLIRTHGNTANGYLAAQIKRALGVPLVVSLHTHPDESYRRRAAGWKARLMGWRQLMFERETLRAADWVLPVYESIVPYAQRRGARCVRVCYNMLNPSLGRKTDYTLHSPPRLISVGRQMPGKEPDQIIRAVARLPGVQLTMVGDGVYHARLRALAEAEGIADRVDFYRAIPNAELCRMLPGYDIFAVHCDYAGVPKAVLEPLLAGLPVVMNRRQGTPVPELQGDWVMLVENTAAGYYEALRQLLADHATREALGRCAYAHAQARYAPEQTEQAFVDIYYSLLETGIK